MKKSSIKAQLRQFEKKSYLKAFVHIFGALIPLSFMVYINYNFALNSNYTGVLCVSIVASLFMIRLFAMCHDSGHYSFTPSRILNEILGHIGGFIILAPFPFWKYMHNLHHAGAGNLDLRSMLDVVTLTKKEFKSLNFINKLGYRIFRWIPFHIGIYIQFSFIIAFRLPLPMFSRKGQLAIIIYDIFYGLLIYGLLQIMTWQTLMITVLPIYYFTFMVGSIIFFIQHQFEEVHWSRTDDFDFNKVGIDGTTFWDLPYILQWLMGNLGYHHIHHLNSNIPNYNLRAAHEFTIDKLKDRLKIITLSETMGLFRHKLYDEEHKKMVPFGE